MLKKSLLVLTAFALAGCTSSETKDPVREPSGIIEATLRGHGKAMDDKELLAAASSGRLAFSKAMIITDNDHSFWQKYTEIEAARPGDTVRMVYYIFTPDHSTQFLNELIVRKAQQGVKFKILLDLLTGYVNIDAYRALTEQSSNIEFRFWGKATPLMERDLRFLTMNCLGERVDCAADKWKRVKAPMSKEDQFYQKLLLAGIYGRSLTAVQTAILFGQSLNLKELRNSSGPSLTPEDLQGLKDLLELLYQAELKNDIQAKVKLYMALIIYKDKVGPLVDMAYSTLPFEKIGGNGSEASKDDWIHSTDFTHHKLLLVGNKFVQLGGRNIENSYHMQHNELTGKYKFVDTEFAGWLKDGGDDIAKAYDRLWNFDVRTISLKDLLAQAPIDWVKNSELLAKAAEACESTIGNRSKAYKCLTRYASDPSFQSSKARSIDERAKTKDFAEKYEERYLKPHLQTSADWKADLLSKGIDFPAQDLSAMTAAYIENTPYTSAKPQKRIFGATDGSELQSGKTIHHLWLRGLESACVQAQKTQKPTDVILYNAYWLPPANIMRGFAKMMDGTWNCKGVTVKILTNSFKTTDLNYINIFARYQTRHMIQTWLRRWEYFGWKSKEHSANFEYHEVTEIPGAEESKRISLHSKVSVFGEDIVIGSANADPRSYMMDTNNGIYLMGATQTAKTYRAYLNDLIKGKKELRTENLVRHYAGTKSTPERLKAEDAEMLRQLIAKADKKKRLSPAQVNALVERANEIGDWMYKTSGEIYRVPESGHPHLTPGDSERYIERLEQQRRFNEFLQVM